MMTVRTRYSALALTLAGVLVAGGLACTEPTERVNAPPQGEHEYVHPSQETYINMTDNAMLAEMSMSPAHFVPHRAELNALGVRRLNRYAEILKTYGGTLRYDGVGETGTDEEVHEKRVEAMRDYLLSCGLAEERFEAEQGLAGGQGMDATLAVIIRRETNFGGEARLSRGAGSGRSN